MDTNNNAVFGPNLDRMRQIDERKLAVRTGINGAVEWFASDFAAEIGVRNYPRLSVFSGDPRGVVYARVRSARRRPTNLSAETKWEIFLQVTAGEITQAEAARKWRVDVSTSDRDPAHGQGRRVGGAGAQAGTAWRATGVGSSRPPGRR